MQTKRAANGCSFAFAHTFAARTFYQGTPTCSLEFVLTNNKSAISIRLSTIKRSDYQLLYVNFLSI